ENEDLRDVDRREHAADDERLVGTRLTRALVSRLLVMVEPVNERVLIHEPVNDEAIGAFDWERAISPRAVREHDGGEPELVLQRADGDVPTELRLREKVDAGRGETLVDLRVLAIAQLSMPAR